LFGDSASPTESATLRRFEVAKNGFEPGAEILTLDDYFVVPTSFFFDAVNTPVIGDFDGDGDDDVALIAVSLVDESGDANEGFEEVLVIVENDGGELARYTVVSPPTEGENTTELVSAFRFLQVDRDPELELVLSEIVLGDETESSTVWLMDRDPATGEYGADEKSRRPLLAGPTLPALPVSMSTGDFDGDGVEDVFVGGLEAYAIVSGVPEEP
jgi:hypothetical protein